MYYWPVSSALMGITTNIFLVTILIVWFYGRYQMSDLQHRSTASSPEPNEINTGSDVDSQSTQRSRRRNNHTNRRQPLSGDASRNLSQAVNRNPGRSLRNASDLSGQRRHDDHLANSRLIGLTRQRPVQPGRSSEISSGRTSLPNRRNLSPAREPSVSPTTRTVECQTESTYLVDENSESRTESEFFDTVEDINSRDNIDDTRTERTAISGNEESGVQQRAAFEVQDN